MLRLKRLLFEVRMRQEDFARLCGMSRNQMRNVLNQQCTPFPRNRKRIMHMIQENDAAMKYLSDKNLPIDAIWDEVPDEFYSAWLRVHLSKIPTIVPGDPLYIETHKEAHMLSPKTLRQFKMFRSPFVNDISDTKDIFLSEDHLFLKEMMLDTARHKGFTAVYGECGSGKSVMRKSVVQELINEEIRVIFPVIVDKSRITPGSLIDAVIMDISEETPKHSNEAKTRQALRLLRNRAASGLKQVLIIEEAHLLTVTAMKALKQIYELEDGFSRLVGIILIGQPELRSLLDEVRHPELREVSRRVTVANINGLGEDVERYLEHKLKRIGANLSDIIAPDTFAAIIKRMQAKDGRRIISKAYPLSVNNLVTRAMNLAADMGEAKVTAEIIMNL